MTRAFHFDQTYYWLGKPVTLVPMFGFQVYVSNNPEEMIFVEDDKQAYNVPARLLTDTMTQNTYTVTYLDQKGNEHVILLCAGSATDAQESIQQTMRNCARVVSVK